MSYVISLYQDTRRAKKDGSFPVKLRVFHSVLKTTKLYPVNIDLSEKDFKAAWETTKPRTEHKDTRLKLQAIETTANEVAEKIKPFSFEVFEKKMFSFGGDMENVFQHYEETIERLRSNGNIGNANNYELSAKSLKEFLKALRGKELARLSFVEVTPDLLQKYENYMVKDKKRSYTTVSMYVRALRTIFNNAILEGDIDREIYPFGKKKYQVPAARNVKKALSKVELGLLFRSTPDTPDQEKARDFFFFSYICNGMNMRDIAELRFKNLQGDTMSFYRTKTINTSKGQLKPVTVLVSDFAREVIKKHGKNSKDPEQFVFPILKDSMNDSQKHRQVKLFTRYINQHIQNFAESIGIKTKISTYMARHSFATNAIRNGASMEFVSEALSHANMKTTQNYFAGFDLKEKKNIAAKLLDFSIG